MSKLVLFTVAMIIAMSAAAHAQRAAPAGSLQAPAASQTLQAPYSPAGPDVGPDQSRSLFSIGRVPVVVWSPVEHPYDAHMNRTAAANPFWGPEAF